MAPTEEMQEIALKHLPNAVCLVPEKREEVTTEGGLDIIKDETRLRNFIEPLKNSGCRISIFIGAEKKQVDAAFRVGAQVVELHTGAYCDLFFDDMVVERDIELERLVETARYASEIGLEVHAGHGLTYDTVKPIAEIAELTELNIGHFLVGESIFCGMEKAITQMQTLMNEARSNIVID
jgi:pyridoxine 5-phosphate synthase